VASYDYFTTIDSRGSAPVTTSDKPSAKSDSTLMYGTSTVPLARGRKTDVRFILSKTKTSTRQTNLSLCTQYCLHPAGNFPSQ